MAMEEIGRTEIRKTHAVIFVGLFIAFLYGVFLWDLPVLRGVPSIAGATAAAPPVSPSSATPMASILPQWSNPLFNENRKILNWIKATERQVDEHSPFVRAVQPAVQSVLAACGEGGTEVLTGKDGWLFYRPSFRFLTRRAERSARPGAVAARSEPSEAAGYHASLAAVTHFAQALRERGISLVLVPAWPKLSVHPEFLGGPAYRQFEVLKPAEFSAWREALEQAGVVVFDPAHSLMDAKTAHGGMAYLKTDSHWNPVAMQTCAADLARFLTNRGLVRPGTAKATRVPRAITNEGDLARMLKLPSGSRQYPPEQVEISEVRGDKGIRWLCNRESPVLLLGDSFCNIFSLASMGWGQDAGFAEHLGAELGMPVDAILRNGDGASATRSLLARELATGKDRLAGKRVVVWEFAASQLTEGRWLSYPYELVKPPASDGQFVEVADEDSEQVSATVAEIGAVPHPSATVYKEFVGYLVLEDLKPVLGHALTGHKAVVYGLVMKDHQWTALANLRPGQHIRANLRSWTSAEDEFARHHRCEPTGGLITQPVNWLAEFAVED